MGIWTTLSEHRRWLIFLTAVAVAAFFFGAASISTFAPLIATDRNTLRCILDGSCFPNQVPRMTIDQLDNANITHLLDCTADGSCLGGNATFDSVSTIHFTCTGNDVECYGERIKTINHIFPDVALNFQVDPGQNIAVDPQVNGITVRTTDAVSVMQFSVSGATMLGLNTSCMKPLQPSCYDISGQQCTTPLGNNCWPSIATFDTIVTNNLLLLNGSAITLPTMNVSTLSLDTAVIKDIILTESMVCSNSSIVAQSCLNLGGYSCPFGSPLADSCFPANMTFYDEAVTHELSVNLVQCLGPPLPLPCFPLLSGDVTGSINGTYITALQGTPLSVSGPLTAYDLLSYQGGQWINAPSSPLNTANTYMRRDAFGNASANVVTSNSVQSIDAGQCLGVGRSQPTTDMAYITQPVYLFDRDSYYGVNDTVYLFDLNTGARVVPALGNLIGYNDYVFNGLDGKLYAMAGLNMYVLPNFPSSMSPATLVCSISGITAANLLGFASDGRAIVIDTWPYPLTSLYLIDTNTCIKTLITINVPAFSLFTAYRDTVYILSADSTTPTTNLWAIDNVLLLSGTQHFIASTRIRSQVNTLYGPPDQFFPICYKGAMRLFVTGGSTVTFTALLDLQGNVMPAVGLNTDTLNYLVWFYMAPSNPFECSPPPQPAATCLDGNVDANGHDIRNISIAYVTEIRGNAFRKGIGNPSANVTIPDRLVLLEDITFGNDTRLSRPQKGRIQTDGDFVARGHFIVDPYVGPTVVAGPAAGTSPTVSLTVNSNDCKMQVSLTTGTATPSNDILFTVTYGKPFQYNITKGVVFSPANANAVGTNVFVDGATESLTQFIFRVTSPPLAISTLYLWNFQACV